MSIEFVARAGPLGLDHDGVVWLQEDEDTWVVVGPITIPIEDIQMFFGSSSAADWRQLQTHWALLNNEEDAHIRSYLTWAPPEPDPDADLHFARCEYREGAL